MTTSLADITIEKWLGFAGTITKSALFQVGILI
jgi:hypothetical protein